MAGGVIQPEKEVSCMAKLKGPLFSLGASQQLGKSLVFFPWKGLDVVREYVIPSNPRTALQTTQRSYLTQAVLWIHEAQADAASPFNVADLAAYALWGSTIQAAMTWFNTAVKNCIDQRVAGLNIGVFRAGAVTPGANQLAISLNYSPHAMTAGNFHYGTSKTALVNIQVATMTASSAVATIAGLTTGVKYFIQFRGTAPAAAIGVRSGIYYGYPT